MFQTLHSRSPLAYPVYLNDVGIQIVLNLEWVLPSTTNNTLFVIILWSGATLSIYTV